MSAMAIFGAHVSGEGATARHYDFISIRCLVLPDVTDFTFASSKMLKTDPIVLGLN